LFGKVYYWIRNRCGFDTLCYTSDPLQGATVTGVVHDNH